MRYWLSVFIENIKENIPYEWLLLIILPILAIIIMLVCISIDRVRIFITKPLENFLAKKDWNKWINYSINYLSKITK